MNKFSKKTIRILTKIKEHILEEPKRLDMGTFGIAFTDTTTHGTLGDKVPACKTQGCIAGWAIFLQTPWLWKEMISRANEEYSDVDLQDNIEPEDEGQRILGLDAEQAHRLFYFKGWNTYTSWGDYGWPEKFQAQYETAKTSRGRANATARRIDHFIATNGAE